MDEPRDRWPARFGVGSGTGRAGRNAPPAAAAGRENIEQGHNRGNRLDQHFDDATLSWCRLLVLAPRLAAMADRALYDSHALANVARYGVPFGAGAAAAARSAVQQGVGRGDPAHGSASAG